jgi:hypothetical protein
MKLIPAFLNIFKAIFLICMVSVPLKHLGGEPA